MKNAFRVFFVDLFFGFTGREPEVRANKEPSENADLFAIFWGDAVKQGFSLEKLLPSKAHQKVYKIIFIYSAIYKCLLCPRQLNLVGNTIFFH